MQQSFSPQVRNKLRTQFDLSDSASEFHNKVGRILATDSFFKNLHCYQEVNVKDLVPDYPYSDHHFDWYIEELLMVIELHGQQHYKPTAYGKISYELKHRNFLSQQERDRTKEYYARTNNYEYRAISYKYYNKLDSKLLKTLLFQGEAK